MTTLPLIQLNPDAKMRRGDIDEDAFYVVVDDFLADPQGLIEFACANEAAFARPEYPYPGIRLDLRPEMLRDVHRFIRNRISKEFGFLRGDVLVASGISMATDPPEMLSNYQRLCHTDPRDDMGRRKYAALVYLYEDERLGGTAFYRLKQPEIYYRALELEMQDPEQASAFLAEHTELWRQPPQYMSGSNEIAELLAVVPARFNRFVFYSGEIHHSGHITAPELLTPDLRKGRLTLNCFVSVVPK